VFGWFAPRSPCDAEAKRWVENRLEWLSKQFGLHVLLERAIVVPTAEYFPDPWDGAEEAVQAMFRRTCGYMGVEPTQIRLHVYRARSSNSSDRSFAAGTWSGGGSLSMSYSEDRRTAEGGAAWPTRQFRSSRSTIQLERSTLDRPSDVVGVLAHELAHERLIGEARVSGNSFDNELLTDLTAVFFGLGVFLANNPRKSTGELLHWPGTELRRPEYLSEPMLAYALAHIAWHRDEPNSAWAKHLRWAPRAAFKAALRYLQKTSDSTFLPARLRGKR
jgi:hypothetical protein